MKIAITGPLGHIGSKLIHVLQTGMFSKVLLIDNMFTQRYCSLFNLPTGVPFEFVEIDILQDNLETRFKEIDVVIHLAAITNAEASFSIQDQVENVNYEGTRKVAQACTKCKCRMIFLSTTSVYGTQGNLVDENCGSNELKPQSPYAESKLKAERYLAELSQSSDFRYVICRFGTIFGSSIGMRFHTAVNKFIWQACCGVPITVWKTALNQRRPYLEINDAINALLFIIKNDFFNKTIYNVVTLNATVGEIVEAIRKRVVDLNINFVDSKIMNQLSYEVSTDKFKKLGFNYSGSLENSVNESIKLLCNIRS
jgi:UDP-glucose 4-epimerase